MNGSGDITLMVGTTIVELTGISGNIVLDCALKEAYKNTTLMNDHSLLQRNHPADDSLCCGQCYPADLQSERPDQRFNLHWLVG